MNMSTDELRPDVWKPASARKRLADAFRLFLLRRGLASNRGGEPLLTEHSFLGRWRRKPFGSHEKPYSLAEVDWDYVKRNETKIPFLGLREYWYPAIKLKELGSRPVSRTLLGDNVVFFRDAQNRPAALENRCPHRGALLSLGQVGVYEPGTISCRYHGMTFDMKGICIAVLTDGPDSPACGKIRVRSYPVEEAGGLVWIYMGKEAPKPLLDAVPHLREIVTGRRMFVHDIPLPFNHLNTLDNDADLAHPGCLHRTCALFAAHKLYGRIVAEDLPDGSGVRTYYGDAEENAHPGRLHVTEVEWRLPNLAYFKPKDFGIRAHLGEKADKGFFWAVPNTIDSCTGWLINSRPYEGWFSYYRGRLMQRLLYGVWWRLPGTALSCIDDADAAMMQAQGRIANWERDKLLRIDVGVVAARRIVKQAWRNEQARHVAPSGPKAGREPVTSN